ncbi:Octaprenyl diphosphate synthase [Saezia sanguinis]|uniref:Octaprenyl diphosphate synthase n=1 Tax=Saezia sanguinis TaxID=1965230 RepID=A0A433SEN3_9BURK|nr:polyprenyl synthetase family protein [Saezia sanguinis]RUS67198.1 Octaprenyl diphosphate synthase [Saezia sanguinis]
MELATPELAALNEVIRNHLHSDVVLIRQIAEYIISSGGKRLRPVMHMLIARALGHDSGTRHLLAAVIEFIHTSTLLHDDVVDESALRRGKNTANAVFGNAASVLVGDFLYSRSFQMMVSVGSMHVQEILADATNVIAEGEVMQLMNAHDPDVNIEGYMQVIRYKTAKLFEASTRLGAVIANTSTEIEEACSIYGQAVGTAFQIIDDILDYEGNAEEMGKNVGDDLREGKPTLPLIIAMQRGTDEQRELVRNAIIHGDAEHLPQIVQAVHATGGIDFSREVAIKEARRGCDALEILPASQYKKALIEFALQSVDRRA